jgi:hypothetical protein
MTKRVVDVLAILTRLHPQPASLADARDSNALSFLNIAWAVTTYRYTAGLPIIHASHEQARGLAVLSKYCRPSKLRKLSGNPFPTVAVS